MSIDPAARRDAIISAVVAQIADTGSPDVAMADVVRASGCALKTIYRAFGSKDLLLVEALAVWHRGMVSRAVAAPAAASVRDRVLHYLESCLLDFARDRGMARLLVRNFATTDPSVAAALGAIHQTSARTLGEFLSADAPTITLTHALANYGLTVIAAGQIEASTAINEVCAAARVSLDAASPSPGR